jgi:hypothetical protein
MSGDQKSFDPPVSIRIGDRAEIVRSAAEAVALLSSPAWPEQGPRRRDAVETALKADAGERTAEEARRAFLEAVRESGLAVDN